LAATHERFTHLFLREVVQERFRQVAKLPPEAILDLELNMGERLGPPA